MKKFLVVLVLLFPLITFAQTTTSTVDLQALIKQLQAQVAELQVQIQSLKTELRITRVLTQGATGDDVRQLQEFLKTIPDVYPEGLVTGYFGPLTKAAIQRFQEKQGIVNSGSSETTGFGIVGPRTASKINELINTGAGASGVIPPGLLTAPGISGAVPPVTGQVTGSVIPQTQTSVPSQATTSIAPAQSAITTSVSNTSVSNTTSGAATTTSSSTPVPASTQSSTTSASAVSTTSTSSTTTTTSDNTASGTAQTATSQTVTTSDTSTTDSSRKMFTGANGDGWGSDGTFCFDSNYSVSMWSDVAGICQDKTGSYTDFCQAPPYEWRKTNYSCTGDVSGTTWTNVRCTTSNNGFVGGSCSAGVISTAPPPPPPPSSTTSRAALQASVLSSLNSLLLQLYELIR